MTCRPLRCLDGSDLEGCIMKKKVSKTSTSMLAAGQWAQHTEAVWLFQVVGFATKSWPIAFATWPQQAVRQEAAHAVILWMPAALVQGEMSEPWLPEKDFANKYMIVPAMPRTGGAARLASLLQGRSMLLGTDSFPIRHPPQYWRDLCRDLQPIIKKEASKAGVPAVQMQHWTMENAACCFTKVIDHLLGLQGHALYKWLVEWKHKEFEPGNLPQCPTKVSIQQSLHRHTIVS